MKNKSLWFIGIGILICLGIIAYIIHYVSSLSLLESVRIVFGSVYVLFLPGFIMSYIFFPKTKTEEKTISDHETNKTNDHCIDFIERIALSFALSIAVVPLAVFYLNLLGMKINLLNSFLTILGIIIISLGIIGIKKIRKR